MAYQNSWVASASVRYAPGVNGPENDNFSKGIRSALSHAQLEALDSLAGCERAVCNGGFIYRLEDIFTALYIVRDGSLKVEALSADGNKHVTGFYFPGDLVALESIGAGQYGSDCIALEDSIVCRLPYQPFFDLAKTIPPLLSAFENQLSSQIRSAHQVNIDRRTFPAEQRLLSFLSEFCKRHKKDNRTKDCVDLRLPMSKADIASYLGIVPESLSRAFTALEKRGVVQRDRHHVRLLCVENRN